MALLEKLDILSPEDQVVSMSLLTPDHFTSDTPQAIFPNRPSLGAIIDRPLPRAGIILNNIFVHQVSLSNTFGGRACIF